MSDLKSSPSVSAGGVRELRKHEQLAEYIAVSLHRPEKARHVELILDGWPVEAHAATPEVPRAYKECPESHYACTDPVCATRCKLAPSGAVSPSEEQEKIAQLQSRADSVRDSPNPYAVLHVTEVDWLLRLARRPSSALPEGGLPELCICAAIRLPDGRVIRGHRHHNCFAAIAELATVDASIPSQSERFEQGFVTSRNRFVDRVEGLALQRAAGIPSADPVRKGYGNQLFSEDLY